MKERLIWKKWVIALVAAALVVLPALPAYAVSPYDTYTYDYWGNPVASPHAYMPLQTVNGADLGAGDMKMPADLFVCSKKNVYIADSGNNRILVLDSSLKLKKTIETFTNKGKSDGFNSPGGLFVSEEGHLYIADTNNARVVELDERGELVNLFGPPRSDIIPEDFQYRPLKLVVDKAKRMYVIAQGVNRGVIEFDNAGNFRGYMGASRVTPNLTDYFWKTIASDAQRERMQLFVPTEYNNIAVDEEGFLYLTISALDPIDLDNFIGTRDEQKRKDKVAPVRRLNLTGTDVLRRQGYFPPVGDVLFRIGGSDAGPSQLVDVTISPDGIYSVLDARRGRIFTYDLDGNLMFAFGGTGSRMGNFRTPVAIGYLDDNLLVLDSTLEQLVLFELTEYGKLLTDAVTMYQNGDYVQAEKKFEQVLVYNENSDIAYTGIGKSQLRHEQFGKSIQSFKLANKRSYYSKAFKFYRTEVMAEHFGWIVLSILAVIVLVYALRLRGKNRGAGMSWRH